MTRCSRCGSWPALAVAGAALLSGALAGRLGGQRFARLLAVCAVLSSPTTIVIGSFFSMNALELLLWPACAYLFVGVLERGGARWLGFGALLGLSMLNKHTSATFAAALVAGSLLTRARHQYATRWPWLGALVAALVVSPNVLWQMTHGWASLDFYEEAQRLKNIPTPALKVLLQQILVSGPGAAPIAALGLVALFRDRSRTASVALGGGFTLLLAALMLAGSSRADRLLGYYPILFAAGATALEGASQARSRWLRPASLGLVAASAAALLPITLPALPPARVAAYAAGIGVVPQIEKNRHSALPQWLADRLSWPAFVADVAAVYRALPPDEQAHALLLTTSYGEAGALELWGPALDLPPVLSNHNTYYLWSRSYLERRELGMVEDTRHTVLISVGVPRETLERWFERVEVARWFDCEYCIDWRQHRPISVARLPRRPLRAMWLESKHFE